MTLTKYIAMLVRWALIALGRFLAVAGAYLMWLAERGKDDQAS